MQYAKFLHNYKNPAQNTQIRICFNSYGSSVVKSQLQCCNQEIKYESSAE